MNRPGWAAGAGRVRGDGGGALLLVILVLLVLSALAHAALVLAVEESRVVALEWELERSRHLARGGVEGALHALEELPPPGTEVTLEVPTPAGFPVRVRLRGAAPGLATAEAVPEGAAPGLPVRRPLARGVVRALVLPELAAEARVPVAGRTTVTVDPASLGSDPDCIAGGWAPRPAPGPAASPSLGPFPVEELARMGGGEGAGGEASGGATPPSLHGAVGAVERRHWQGSGVLAVDGDLVLGEGVDFRGVVLVSGGARLESGARVTGMVRAGGHLRVEAGAGVLGSPCAVLEALAPLAALTAPAGVPGLPEGPP